MQICSELLLELFDAAGANALAVEVNYVGSVVAEAACGLVLLENYLIVVSEYLDSVLLLYVENLSDLNGKNYSSKLVNLTYNTCGFHCFFSFFIHIF